MRLVYTIHAEDKLKEPESKKLFITKKLLGEAILNPNTTEALGNPMRVTSDLDSTHSLVVVYKKESGKIKVITFFPAQKGRYESKVLRRR